MQLIRSCARSDPTDRSSLVRKQGLMIWIILFLIQFLMSIFFQRICGRSWRDTSILSYAPTCIYSSKYGYLSIAQQKTTHLPPWWVKKLQKQNFPQKMELFMWLLLKNKAPTWEIFQKGSFLGQQMFTLFGRCTKYHPYLHKIYFHTKHLEYIQKSIGTTDTWKGNFLDEFLKDQLGKNPPNNIKSPPQLFVGAYDLQEITLSFKIKEKSILEWQ